MGLANGCTLRPPLALSTTRSNTSCIASASSDVLVTLFENDLTMPELI